LPPVFQVLRGALPFFDKRPEFIHLAFVHMIIFDQMLADSLTMTSGCFENECDGVFVNVEDARTSSNAVALSQSFEDTVYGLIISMKTSEDTEVARRKLSAAFQTTIERCSMRSVIADQLEICLNSLATARTAQSGSRFHSLASIGKNRLKELLMLSDPHQLGKMAHE
jgi:hypothetical protein